MATSTKKLAALYRAAAKRIEDGYHYACCYAIRASAGGDSDCERMRKVFYDPTTDYGRRAGHWMVESVELAYGDDPAVQNRRVLALCLMATLVEAGEA